MEGRERLTGRHCAVAIECAIIDIEAVGPEMSQLLKLLERIRRNPRGVRFAELRRVLSASGFVERRQTSGSSHRVFVRADGTSVTVPESTGHVSQVYVRAVLEVLGDATEEGTSLEEVQPQ